MDNTLLNYHVPQWLMDGKFGIYTHWGVYSVPACGPNGTWYGYNMYREGSLQNLYHRLNYGEIEAFGYKDFIPKFTAEKFDPDEWGELFKKSGAKFAGPVGEHHDGFSMWNSEYNKWNAYRMGPHRDVLRELEKSIRNNGLKFMVAMHHAENWYFYPHWKYQYDVSKPEYQELYGGLHNRNWRDTPFDKNVYIPNHEKLWELMERPDKKFLDRWLNKLKEIIDSYSPDLFWFDFGLKYIAESYKDEFLRYYHHRANEKGQEIAVTYKWHNLIPGSGIEDLEQGQRAELAYNFWVTDTTVDDGEAWGYLYNNTYKKPETLIHYLIDNVSKNGALILSICPKPDGTIPVEVSDILLEMGRWLELNGEAIYSTRPWIIYGEGPNKVVKGGAFSDSERIHYTSKDIRYTGKADNLYAIIMGVPEEDIELKAIFPYIYPEEIQEISLLDTGEKLLWSINSNRLIVNKPKTVKSKFACVLRIRRKREIGGRC